MKKYTIDYLLKPVHKFIHLEFTGGIVLFLAVVAALIWANSPAGESYYTIWELELSAGIAGSTFSQPLHVWINDGLMALFFFVIGLELKREFIAGELSSWKKASLPMIAALGGMLVPALIYTAFNHDLPSSAGWGIPMATDIAFALGLLSLAGKRVPPSVKVFLSALAVADDLGAVLVIAIFYTGSIAWAPLLIALGVLCLLWAGNRIGIRSTVFYLIGGVIVWYFFLLSGVHATIAGVLVACMIPARTKINEEQYVTSMKRYTDMFERAIPQNNSLTTAEQHHTIGRIKKLSLDAETPLQKIESGLHPWVAFLIMPLFALANSGIIIDSSFFYSLTTPVSMGVSAGLVIGKFAGIASFIWLSVKLGWTELPVNAVWRHMIGVALLAGVGFTMSLFITALAFDDPGMINSAKSGILLASFISGILGIIVLKSGQKGRPAY